MAPTPAAPRLAHTRRTPLWLLLPLAGCPRPTPPAAPPVAELPAGTLSAAHARADAEHLYATLREAHYDLYAHTDPADYDAAFAALLARLDAPVTRVELARELMAFAALGRFGHSQVVFPVPEYIGALTEGDTVLPFDVRPDGDRVWVAHSAHADVPVGAELVSLDGRAGIEWVERLGSYVSAENPRLRDAQLETMFPRLHWLHGEGPDTHTVELRVGGELRSVEVPSLPGMDLEIAKSEWETSGHVRTAELLPGPVGYFRPGPFYAMEGEGLEEVVSFVDTAFASFVEGGATAVILDLRDNPGGDNSFSDPMLAWVADAPFAFASEYRVKASAETRRVLGELAAADPDGISAAMLTEMGGHADGETFAFPIPEVAPRAERFDGAVWALVNRHSYSNATVVAAMVQDYGMGQVAGEETADLPSSYASSAQFTLPHSGFPVVYPKGWFARPSGVIDDRGVIPDLAIPTPPPGTEGDPVLDALLAHIRGQ